MSYQFSFLQVFAGYNSANSLFAIIYQFFNWLKKIQVSSHYSQRMSQESSTFCLGTIAIKCSYSSIELYKKVDNHQGTRRLNKFLNQSARYNKQRKLYNIYIVIWLCKKMLRNLRLLKEQPRISNLRFAQCSKDNGISMYKLRLLRLRGIDLSFKFLQTNN